MLIDINKTFRLLLDKLQSWFDSTVLILPNLVLAVLVFSLFLFFARISKRLIDRLLANIGTADNVKSIIKSLVSMIIYLAGAFSALEVLGLEKTVTSILAGAGLIGLAISLAFQNIAANVISGLIINFRQPFFVGDYIQCSEHVFGKVTRINIPNTILLTDEGQFITVPNKEIWEKNIVNYSKFGLREIEIKLPVALDADLKKAIQLAQQTLVLLPFVQKKDSIDVFYLHMGTYAVELSINFWIRFNEPRDFEIHKSDALLLLLDAFRQHHIHIPLPSSQVYMTRQTEQ